MKRHYKILLFCVVISFIACNSPSDRNLNNEIETADNEIYSEEQQDQVEISEPNEPCVRGQAESIIRKEKYPQSVFILQPDSLTAIETFNTDNGDRVTINYWGCEYYVLTFQFETSKYKKDTTDLAYWYQSADQLMTSILAGIDLNAPIDIKRALVFLESYYLKDRKNNYKNLKLAEEIEFDGSEIRSFVTLDRIEQINDQKFSITLSFATGPL